MGSTTLMLLFVTCIVSVVYGASTRTGERTLERVKRAPGSVNVDVSTILSGKHSYLVCCV